MISLAPIRYARVIGESDSPIHRLEYGKTSVNGKPMFHANAFLKNELLGNKSFNQVYNNADGAGTHVSPTQARFVAISEALERWALYKVQSSSNAKDYGFDIDSTSCGMAAFPGLFKSQARSKALAEAAERYCLVSWWAGCLRHRDLTLDDPFIKGIEINNPISQDRVVLLWKQNKDGTYAYGFAASKVLSTAIWKATVELDRSEAALDQHYRENPNFGLDDLAAINSYFEKRILFYAMPEGHAVFLKRINSPIKSEIRPPVEPIVDTIIEGPWSKYTTVWRILYDMPTQSYRNPESFFFYW